MLLPISMGRLRNFFVLLMAALYSPGAGIAAVAPVAQLPTVTASVTPSPYALPLLLVSDQNEWKDFGIQVNMKIYPRGEEQADRVVDNEWEVGVMDPFYAIKAGNEGDIAVVGIAGNLVSQFYLLTRKETRLPSMPQAVQVLNGTEVLGPVPSAEHFYLSHFLGKSIDSLRPAASKTQADPGGAFLKGKGDFILLRSPEAFSAIQQGFPAWPDFRKSETFLPACLVASAAYADTRKTLVIRWLEGYSRGIRMIQENPSKAASRLKAFYQETLKIEVSQRLLEMEIAAVFFNEKKQEEAFRSSGGNPSAVERFAHLMSDYQVRLKVLKSKKDPGEYILGKICDQLAALRGEAEAQFRKTRMTIAQTEKEGIKVEKLRQQMDEAHGQMEEGRGCLTVIGILSNLMRSAEQARVEAHRFKKFRLIEIGVGGLLLAYYAGYAVWRKKKGKK